MTQIKGKGKSDKLDKEIGLKIRKFRIDRKMSQVELAKKCGVTFQQVQKYERGINRMSASRLKQVADALNVSISYIYNEPNVGDLFISLYDVFKTWSISQNENGYLIVATMYNSKQIIQTDRYHLYRLIENTLAEAKKYV